MFGLFKKKSEAPPPLPTQPPCLPSEPPRANAPNHFAAPLSDFEHYILAFHRREIPIQKFLEEFFNAQVFVLSDHEQFSFGDQGASLAQKPRLFSIIQPEVTFLTMFSHADRARPVQDKHPDMRFALQLHAGEFLMGLASDIGLALNPYWDINFHWSPKQLSAIKETMKR